MIGTGERAVGIYRLQHPILNFYLILKAEAAWIKLPVCTKRPPAMSKGRSVDSNTE